MSAPVTPDSDSKEKFDDGAPLPELSPDFQEGGLRGWLVVLGCFLITAVTIGLRYACSVIAASMTDLSSASQSRKLTSHVINSF